MQFIETTICAINAIYIENIIEEFEKKNNEENKKKIKKEIKHHAVSMGNLN